VIMMMMWEGCSGCLVAGVCNECNDCSGRETHDGSFQIKVVGLKMKEVVGLKKEKKSAREC